MNKINNVFVKWQQQLTSSFIDLILFRRNEWQQPRLAFLHDALSTKYSRQTKIAVTIAQVFGITPRLILLNPVLAVNVRLVPVHELGYREQTDT